MNYWYRSEVLGDCSGNHNNDNIMVNLIIICSGRVLGVIRRDICINGLES